ncbi:hypothetical protein ACF0H5_000162 [Mactra antiquata]
MASKCRKFVPNIFNKTKCQTCFGSKEQHSAEALENNKASRKVSKCGYLFVAPGYDFSNPLDKTKRWQRRFFILYDDGELAYSVDENPDTVPQGVVDMNKCTDVKDASGSTSHQNSLAIITPEKTTYIKANSKEEIQWWSNILMKFAEENVVIKRPFQYNDTIQYDTNDKENIDTSNIIDLEMAKSSEMQTVTRSTPPPASPTRQGASASPSTKFEDLMYMKKGWLIKMGSSEKDWKKHWFVLTGNSLRYYKDAKAEETNNLDGRIDLSSCYEISEVQIQRNYGFKIKTRNGEYILSAMTSGIRSNWMKAIRLCMDLQNSNKNKESKPSQDSTVSLARTNDDMDIDSSSSSSSRTSDNTRGGDKKKFNGNKRRHYSDVNPGNISKMFSIKGLTLDTSKSLSQSMSSHSSGSSLSSSKEPSIEREVKAESALPSHMDLATSSKQGKYDQYNWSSEGETNIPLRRFVEGSDSHVGNVTQSNDQTNKSKAEEEERKRRAKSPSAKIKERSRAKSPKLHSPPPDESDAKFSYRTPAAADVDKISVSSEEIDYMESIDMDENLDADDNLPSGVSSAGKDIMVDLLENEVEALKERLEHTQQELVKSHDSNRDLKTKLQTVVREKDPSQINAMKRQLKEAKDTMIRNKSDYDQLKSKLDMSTSKLTGTEKALSEALKDVKQEKDKFLKVSTEYNKKVRNLEGQLKDVTQKMEKYHENSLIKDKENRKLDLDLKQTQQKLRDHEREVLKLKAVEHEYRQMKEKMDETEKIASRMRMDLKEKDDQIKKMEIEFDEQYESLMQDFSKERDATEQHVEDLKSQLVEAQKKSNMSDQVSSDVAEMLREKDEIIAQLEEKVIESETKMVELTDELKADEDEITDLHQNIELFQTDQASAFAKIKELEKSAQYYQSQGQRMEKENASIRKHMDDLRKENTELSSRLDAEKSDVSNLVEDNDSLKSNVKDLELEVHSLHEKLNEVVASQERHSHSSDGTSQELLHTFVLASAEMNDVCDNIVEIKKKLEPMIQKGEQKTNLACVSDMLESLGQKCDSIADVLKEGDSQPESEKVVREKAPKVESSNTQEIEALKMKNKEIQNQNDKLKKDLHDASGMVKSLQSGELKLKEKLQSNESNHQGLLEALNKRVDEFVVKNKVEAPKSQSKPTKKSGSSKDPVALSDAIAEQLHELEEKVGMVEKVLNSHDFSMSSTEGDSQTETEDSEAETEDSDDYLDLESDESDDDSEDGDTVADENEGLLGKLKEMKKQLQSTNNRIKELTGDINDLGVTDADCDNVVESELRQTLLKCGEKVDDLTVRLSDGLKHAKTETPHFSDCTWAFQTCVSKLKDKLTEISVLMHEHDDLNAKDLKHVQEKVGYLAQYVNEVDKLGENDWDVAGKIAKQELKFQHLLAHKENAARKSTLKYEDRLQLYADKLAFEAMILGQMGILIQRQQIGSIYKDVLLKEIHEVNLDILDLERRIDGVTREMNQFDQEKDLVSSYAAILAEKIVLEGQLATGAMVQDLENSENMEVLSALNVTESPAVLAMEIFLRSQVDSSVTEQLQKFAEKMSSFTNHIVTRALLQGEITHALQVVKKKFKPLGQSEDLSSLVKRERQFAFNELQNRRKLVSDLMNESEPIVMTTLIQLIEFSQGPNSPTLDSICQKITSIVNNKVEEIEISSQSADSDQKVKLKHIISHLRSELSDAILIFREDYQCYVQTASSDINPNVLKFSADSLSCDLAEMIIQKAIIDGAFSYVEDLYKTAPDVSVSQMMEPMPAAGEGLSDLAKSLGQILLTESANKQKIAEEVRKVNSGDVSGAAKAVTNLVGVIPDLEAYPQSFDIYAATLVREAMFQSQLTYTTYKLKLHYHKELRDIKIKMEAGEKVLLPSEISREAESDIQASMTTFEEILNTKFQDECAVLNQLEEEIGKVKAVPGEKSCSKCKSFEANMKALEKTFQHEVAVAQERQNVHIDVLRQEVNNVIIRVQKFLEDNEKEKESLISDYEDRICTLQDEFDLMRIDHEDELEQVKQDIMTAVSAIKATEEETESTNLDQLKHHNKQLMKMCSLSKELLSEIKDRTFVDQGEDLITKIESQMSQIAQVESDPSYTMHVDKLLERSQHEHEMEQLKREKEEALAEEIRDTKAALDVMRKAYEEELEQEKEKYRHALKTMFTDNYVDDIRRRHDIEVEKLSEELKQVKMHYESRCEDYKLLEDRLARTKSEYQTHINQLVRSNEHLTELVNTEIDNLKSFIQTRNKGHLTGNATLEEELYDSQIMVRVKDAELQKLRQQVKNLENSLERITEEQRYTMTQYLQCLKKNQEIQAKLKEGTFTSKERKDSTSTQEDSSKNVRALRRNLKRSKSSPSLPFVFEAKGTSTPGVANRQSLGSSTRRESTSKLAKISKK